LIVDEQPLSLKPEIPANLWKKFKPYIGNSAQNILEQELQTRADLETSTAVIEQAVLIFD